MATVAEAQDQLPPDTSSVSAEAGLAEPSGRPTPTAEPDSAVASTRTGTDERSDVGESQTDKDDDRKNGAKKPPWEKKPKLDVQGLLRALWELQDSADEPSNEFRIPSARIELDWRQAELLEGVVEVEFAQEPESVAAWSSLRDAYFRVRPLRELQFRVGQFKKPVSRLELRSRRKLKVVERGLGNDWIIEELGYGGRDIGVQIEGKVGGDVNLSYDLGVFNGSGPNASEVDTDGSKDFAARLELDVGDVFSIGLSGSHQRFDPDVTPELPRSASMAGADFRIEAGELRLLGEGMLGENQLSLDQAKSWSVLTMASYRIPLTDTWKMALEPVVKAEVLKVEHHIRDAHVWQLTAGVNYLVGKRFRVMTHGDWVIPTENTPEDWFETRRLLVQGVLVIR